jgi:hypothetical protein
MSDTSMKENAQISYLLCQNPHIHNCLGDFSQYVLFVCS